MKHFHQTQIVFQNKVLLQKGLLARACTILLSCQGNSPKETRLLHVLTKLFPSTFSLKALRLEEVYSKIDLLLS